MQDKRGVPGADQNWPEIVRSKISGKLIENPVIYKPDGLTYDRQELLDYIREEFGYEANAPEIVSLIEVNSLAQHILFELKSFLDGVLTAQQFKERINTLEQEYTDREVKLVNPNVNPVLELKQSKHDLFAWVDQYEMANNLVIWIEPGVRHAETNFLHALDRSCVLDFSPRGGLSTEEMLENLSESVRADFANNHQPLLILSKNHIPGDNTHKELVLTFYDGENEISELFDRNNILALSARVDELIKTKGARIYIPQLMRPVPNLRVSHQESAYLSKELVPDQIRVLDFSSDTNNEISNTVTANRIKALVQHKPQVVLSWDKNLSGAINVTVYAVGNKHKKYFGLDQGQDIFDYVNSMVDQGYEIFAPNDPILQNSRSRNISLMLRKQLEPDVAPVAQVDASRASTPSPSSVSSSRSDTPISPSVSSSRSGTPSSASASSSRSDTPSSASVSSSRSSSPSSDSPPSLSPISFRKLSPIQEEEGPENHSPRSEVKTSAAAARPVSPRAARNPKTGSGLFDRTDAWDTQPKHFVVKNKQPKSR